MNKESIAATIIVVLIIWSIIYAGLVFAQCADALFQRSNIDAAVHRLQHELQLDTQDRRSGE